MSQNVTKLRGQHELHYASIRVKPETKKKKDKLRQLVNNKKWGKTIFDDEIVSYALDLLINNETHIKHLKEKSISNTDREKILLHLYLEENPQHCQEDFASLKMKPSEWSKFLKRYSSVERYVAI